MHKPLPLPLLQQSFRIDPASPTWLTWQHRPLSHFSSSRRQKQSNTRCAGKPAGNISFSSRQNRWVSQVFIAGEFYQTSRVVYAIAHGIDPGCNDVDHIDGNRRNNDPANLRLVPHFINCHNRKVKSNYSGVTGVYWLKKAGLWHSSITVNGKRISLGCYRDKQAAVDARLVGEMGCIVDSLMASGSQKDDIFVAE